MPTNRRIMMISTHGHVSAEPEFGLPDTGGQVVYVLELSKCLARMGYAVDIYTRQFEDQPAEEPVEENVRIVRVPCGGRDFIAKEKMHRYIEEWIENAAEYIETEKLEYGYINSHYWDAGLAGLGLSDRLHVPHVHTPHSLGAWKRDNMDGDAKENERIYNFVSRIRCEQAVYSSCDLMIATTPQQRELLAGQDYDVPREKIAVVPPGYDDNRFYPVSLASRMALKRDHGVEGRVILAVGRMAHNKGYDLLLQAMPYVFERVEDAKLLLAIGSTEPSGREQEQIAELKELAEELGIAERVIFHDYITDEELADYYRLADVFALSSRYEPFGMTAVEAMACGTPTIVTTEGGLWEQVVWGIDVLYANPFDPPSYGHAIAFMLTQPRIWAQLSRYGTHKARSKFTWTGVAQQVVGLMRTRPERLAAIDDTNLLQPHGEAPWTTESLSSPT